MNKLLAALFLLAGCSSSQSSEPSLWVGIGEYESVTEVTTTHGAFCIVARGSGAHGIAISCDFSHRIESQPAPNTRG